MMLLGTGFWLCIDVMVASQSSSCKIIDYSYVVQMRL